MHKSLEALSIKPQISEPVNGIPKMLKLKIPEIEFLRLANVLRLSPNQ